MKGVVFRESAGKEPVGQAGLFGRTTGGQPVGKAFPTVGAVAVADLDQTGGDGLF